MRLIAVCFLLLLALIQYPLWLGKGGWLRVWEFQRQVAQAKANNNQLKERNAKLESEVADLKTGTDSVEERARFELGMIKKRRNIRTDSGHKCSDASVCTTTSRIGTRNAVLITWCKKASRETLTSTRK